MSETLLDPIDQFMFNPVSTAFRQMAIYQLFPAICAQRKTFILSHHHSDPAEHSS